jgi:hypothetical protein
MLFRGGLEVNEPVKKQFHLWNPKMCTTTRAFEVITASTATNAIFCNLTPCSLADFSLCSCFLLLWLLLILEDGSSMFLRNIGEYLPDYTTSYPRIQYSSCAIVLPLKPLLIRFSPVQFFTSVFSIIYFNIILPSETFH